MRRVLSSPVAQATCLSVAILLAYYYAFFDVARQDQVIYLYETRGMHGLWNLISGTYALNRSIPVADDATLFRPVLYALLATEQYLWGRDFTLWQGTSIGLHICVVLSLFFYFRLCCLREPAAETSFWPFILALFFALLYAGAELVAWHHMVGYLLFSLLAVGTFVAYQKLVTDANAVCAIMLVVLMGLACLTYELGNVLAMIMAGVVLAAAGRDSGSHRPMLLLTSAALLCCPLFYAWWSYVDYSSRHLSLAIENPGNFWQAPTDFMTSVLFWTFGALSPLGIQLVPGGRIAVTLDSFRSVPVLLGSALAFLILEGCVRVVIVNNRRDQSADWVRDRLPGAGALLAACAYVAIIVIGREVSRGLIEMLVNNSYYAYIFALFGLLGVFHYCILPLAGSSAKRALFTGRALMVGIGIVALTGGVRIFEINSAQYQTYARPFRHALSTIEQLKALHGREPGFSFSLGATCPSKFWSSWFPLFMLSPHNSYRSYTVFTALYPAYERTTGGTYVVECQAPQQSN